MAARNHHRIRFTGHRAFVLVLTSLLVLVAAPSASARWRTYGIETFVPVTTVRFNDPVELTPAQKMRVTAINAGIPASPRLAVPASGFSLTALGANAQLSASALDCMTAAIYYEAGYEPITGQRAVAQVILNRVRHPAFPDTVCGVVFQGSDRSTGCQFTFTCDGALARRPAPGPWLRARAIASAALAGFVETSVGHATHYHASYVLPAWAPHLTKLTTIGSHIFYQWKGGAARPSAFSANYAFSEAIPAGARNALAGYLLSPARDNLAAAAIVPGQSADPANPAAPVGPDMNFPSLPGEPDRLQSALPRTNLAVGNSQLIERPSHLREPAAPGRSATGGTLAN